MSPLRPTEIVALLDRHITGQQQAKRAIAVALRNRWRAQQAGVIDHDGFASYRYLVTGPKGVGKTRTVQRAAAAIDAPFTRTSTLQLAAAGTAARAIELTFEALIESARLHSETERRDEALLSAQLSGVVLVDGLDRWIQSGDESPDDPLEIARQALYGLAAAPSIATRYGSLRTQDIMVFVSGDLTAVRPVNLPFELQSLFPRRIELESLTQDDLLQILKNRTEPPLHDYIALLRTEGLQLHFTDDGLEAIAAEAGDLNHRIEDIGARRLAEVIEIVLDDLLFEDAEPSKPDVTIDAAYVTQRMAADKDDEDLDDFIL
jgi:ATP-dependent HslUV protease ATP-binding subunit HslU